MLPCGKCLVCLQSKRNDWAFRLSEEHKAAKYGALFVTLTYSNQNIPEYGSLEKSDLQKFFKRLRKRSTDKIRYYAVGEYGSQYLRPHYHAIVFNSNEADIRASWELGYVHVGSVTAASVAYVLKYIVQPDVAPAGQIFDAVTETWRPKFQKPFAVMSRAYGIGAAYLTDEMVTWHKSGGKNYALVQGTDTKIRLPRYYKELVWPKRYLPYKTEKRQEVNSKGKLVTVNRYLTVVKAQGNNQHKKMVIPERIPLSSVEYTEREKVFNLSGYNGRKAIRAERQWFWRNYGKDGNAKFKEHRNALLARIKTKVAFTQTF